MDWRKMEEMADQAISKQFDEAVRISFMKGVASDPTRPQWLGRAILHTGGDDSIGIADGSRYRTRLSAGQAELFLNRSTYTGPNPMVGDRVRGMDRAGTPLWEVRGISDRYSHLIVLSLTQA